MWNFAIDRALQDISLFGASLPSQTRKCISCVGVLADRQAKQFLIAVDSSPKRLRYGYNPLASLATSQDLHNYSLMSRAFNTFQIQRFKQVLW